MTPIHPGVQHRGQSLAGGVPLLIVPHRDQLLDHLEERIQRAAAVPADGLHS